MARVLVCPDLHTPFQHPNAFKFLEETYYAWKCDSFVNLGDECDFHSFGKYPKDPDGHSPGFELALAIDELQKLYRIFPKAKVCVSNHTIRPFKKAYEAGLPKAFLRRYEEFLKAPPKWEWGDKWIIDGVLYIHGEGFSGQSAAITAARHHRQSVGIGHIHSYGGVQYMQGFKDRIFAANFGCLIDETEYAFNYAKHLAVRPTLGCGVVIDGVEAYFIPMPERLKKIKT